MTQNHPQLSIVMPAYNAERYIHDSIKSVLNQSFTNFELIIINDGSSDDTEKIIKSYSDVRIKYHKNEQNRGLFFTRNKGLSVSNGQYIAMLDSDDIALKTKFQQQINFLESNTEIVLVGSSAVVIDEKNNETGEVYLQSAPPEAFSSIMLFNNYIIQSSIVCRGDILKKYGYRSAFPPAEDYDLWVRLAKDFQLYLIKEPLIKYRVHSNSISHTSRNVQINGIKNNYKEQLQSLGIESTEKEIELHYEIANSTFQISTKFFHESREWLKLLHQENRKSKTFPEKIFNYVLLRMWIKIYHKSFRAMPLASTKEFLIFPFLRPVKIFSY